MDNDYNIVSQIDVRMVSDSNTFDSITQQIAKMDDQAKGLSKIAPPTGAYEPLNKTMSSAMKTASSLRNELSKLNDKSSLPISAKTAIDNLNKSISENVKTAAQATKENMTLKAEIKASAMESIKADQSSLEAKAKLSKANTDVMKVTKELSKELLYNEKVTRAMADANGYVEKTMKGVASGALSLSDAEQKLTQNAKAVAQEIMTLKNNIAESGKATTEQVAKLKQLESALDTYKEAADSAGDAQNQFNQLMQNADERLSGNAKAVGMFGASLAGLSGTMGNVFGTGGQMLADFAGSASTAANQFGSMIDQFKAGKDMGGTFQGMMTQATAAIGIAQVGIQAAMQLYAMIDGAIRKGEQAAIEAGKKATESAMNISAYKLTETDDPSKAADSLKTRIELSKQLGEENVALGAKLLGASTNVAEFDRILKETNKELQKTREIGAAKEWEVNETGGGLIGWAKKLGTNLELIYKHAGAAQVALTDMQQTTGRVYGSISSQQVAFSDLEKANLASIKDLQIQILEAEGKKAEAQKERMKLLAMEQAELLQQHKDKIKQIETEKMAYLSSLAGLQKQVSELYLDISGRTTTGLGWLAQHEKDSGVTNLSKIFGISATPEGIKDWAKKLTDTVQKGLTTEWPTVKKSFDVFKRWLSDELGGDLFADLTKDPVTGRVTGFGLDATKGWVKEIRSAIEALYKFQPEAYKGQSVADAFQTQIDALNEMIPTIEKQFQDIIKLTNDLWNAQNKPDKKPTTPDIKQPKYEVTVGNLQETIKNLQDPSNWNINALSDLWDTINDKLAQQGIIIESNKDISDAMHKIFGLIVKDVDAINKSLVDSKTKLISYGEKLRQQLDDILNPKVADPNTKLKQMNAEVDNMIDAMEEAYRVNGKLGDAQVDWFEKQREAFKETNRQIVAAEGNTANLATQEKEVAAEAERIRSVWAGIVSGIADANKIHEEWLQRFDPAGYAKLIADQKQSALDLQIAGLKKQRDDMLSNLGTISPADQARLEKLMGIKFNIADGLKDEEQAIKDWFDKRIQEATDLGTAVATTATKIEEMASSLKDMQDKVKNWQLLPDPKKFAADFNTAFDTALNGDKTTPLEKYLKKGKDSLKDLENSIPESLLAIDDWFAKAVAEAEKGMTEAQKQEFENSQKYRDLEREYGLKQVELTHQTAEKRLAIIRQNALDIAAAYKTEFDKLTSMVDSLNKEIESREKMTGDARTKMTKEVTRMKLKEGERQVYDQAQSLGDEYEGYRKAGLSQLDLEEWLGLKSKDITSKMTADEKKLWDKYWNDRKSMADKVADAENQAWDDRVNKQKQAIQDQRDLVNALYNEAVRAGKAVLAAVGVAVPLPAPGSTSTDARHVAPSNVPKPTVDPPAGMEWDWQVIGGIGRWVAVPIKYKDIGVKPQPGSTGTATGTGKDYPVETTPEIQARIDAYAALLKAAQDTEPKVEKLGTDTCNNLIKAASQFTVDVQKLLTDFAPRADKDWGKSVFDIWGTFGHRIVQTLTAPFIEQLDPAHAMLGTIGHDAWIWGKDIATALGQGFYDGKENLASFIMKAIKEATEGVIKEIGKGTGTGTNSVNSVGDRISSALPGLGTPPPEEDKKPFGQDYLDAIDSIENAVNDAIGNINTVISKYLTDLKKTFNDDTNKILEMLKRLEMGVSNGNIMPGTLGAEIVEAARIVADAAGSIFYRTWLDWANQVSAIVATPSVEVKTIKDDTSVPTYIGGTYTGGGSITGGYSGGSTSKGQEYINSDGTKARDLQEYLNYEGYLKAKAAQSGSSSGSTSNSAGSGSYELFNSFGAGVAQAFAEGALSQESTMAQAANSIASAFAKPLEAHSPPVVGPLSDCDTWLENIVQTMINSVDENDVLAAGLSLANNYTTGIKQGFENIEKDWQGTVATKTYKGMATYTEADDLWGLKAFRKALLSNSKVQDYYNTRQELLAQSEDEFKVLQEVVKERGFQQELNNKIRKADWFTRDYAGGTTDNANKQFLRGFWNEHFDQGLITPDLGELGISDIEAIVRNNPGMKTNPWFDIKLKEQYPELEKKAMEMGYLTPPAYEVLRSKNDPKKITGLKINGVDYADPADVSGMTGFNDFIQKKYLEWGKSKNGSGSSMAMDWWSNRETFLAQNQKEDLVLEYINYVKDFMNGKGSEEDAFKAIGSKYKDTTLGGLLMGNATLGTNDLPEVIKNSPWFQILTQSQDGSTNWNQFEYLMGTDVGKGSKGDVFNALRQRIYDSQSSWNQSQVDTGFLLSGDGQMNEGGSKGSQTLYQYQQGLVPDNMKNVLLAGIGSQIGLPLEALIARGYIGAVSKDVQVSTEKLAMEELIKNLQGLDESIQSLDGTTQAANDTSDKLWQQNQNYENIYRVKVDTTSQEYLDAQTKKAAEEYWQTRLPNEVIGNPDYNKQLAIQQGMPSYRIYGQRYGLGEYDLGSRLQNPWTGDQMPYANPADPTGYWSEWGRQESRTDLTAQATGSADQSWKETDVRYMSPTEAIRLLQAGNLTADDKQFLQLVATGWYQQQHNAGTQDPYFGTWGTSQINQWLGQKSGVGSGVPIPSIPGMGGTLNNYNLATGPNVNLGGGGNVYISNEINIDTVNGVEDFEEVVTKVQTKQFKALGMNVQETD